jgi:hypothetical protein
MNLSLKELNELIYCVGSVITDKTNTYNSEDRQLLFNKLYSELEDRVSTSTIEAISDDKASDRCWYIDIYD